MHPTNLKKDFKLFDKNTNSMEEGLIKSSLGNFGHFQYGTTLHGRVHYPLKNTDGCIPLKMEDFNEDHLEAGKMARHPPIIMVDRGACHFVVKAKNIQKFGGIMALVVDNKDSESPEQIVMADDGKGESVNIPTFLIGKSDG